MADTGIGIPPDQHQAIFQAFRQADGTTSRKFGGTGLGLSISSQLAQRMGGCIELQSETGQGSTFTLYLPLEPAAARKPEQPLPVFQGAKPSQPVQAQPDPLLEGRKVLIVDDDMRNVFSLSSLLQEMRMTVKEAANGLEALAVLDADPSVDLVLMDMMMPEMDGCEAMRRIRSDPRFKALPILALTAKAMRGDREDCLKAGASDYLAKPLDPEKLVSLLRVWLCGKT